MCDCIDMLLQRIVDEKVYKDEGEVEKIDFLDQAFIFEPSIRVQTYSRLELQVVGKKRKPVKKVLHTFCPFCGIKYVPEQKPAAPVVEPIPEVE